MWERWCCAFAIRIVAHVLVMDIFSVQLMQIIGEQDVRIIPDIAVHSGQGGGNGMVDGLLGMVLREQLEKV